MGETSASSLAPISGGSIINTEEFLTGNFNEFDKSFRKDTSSLKLSPALPDKDGTFWVTIDHKFLSRPEAPLIPVVAQPSKPSKLDALYACHFQRLERNLEAIRRAVPSSVTKGKVATLGLVDVSAGGEAVFQAVLEEHVAGPTK